MEDERDILEEDKIEFQNDRKRPQLLVVVSVLSFINLGIGLLGTVFGLLGTKASSDEMEDSFLVLTELKNKFDDAGSEQMSVVFEQLKEVMLYTNEYYYFALMISLIGIIAGLIGVSWMYKGKKNGFHLYIIYNLIAVFGLYMYVPSISVPMVSIITNSIIAMIFILLYAKNLSWMK